MSAWRALLCIGSSLVALAADAAPLTLEQLNERLAAPAAVSGTFVQEKHLRALPKPLVSQGEFLLVRGKGLIWRLRSPLRQAYRITPQQIEREDAGGWQPQPARSAAARQNALFLAVLGGDTRGLQSDFAPALSGDSEHWQLTLTPRSALLKQIFTAIDIRGGALVESIQLRETQGDSTLIRLLDSQASAQLDSTQRQAFE